MKRRAPIRNAPRRGEEGYVLVAVMFMLALLIISLTVAMPRVIKQIQRDRELETYHRGMQYRRAIQLYYRKFHAYPPNIDALVMTNNIRFLRKRYLDPLSRSDDWKPIRFGQNKAPLAMGFFGQPLGGDVLAGTGPGGIPGASPPGDNPTGLTGVSSSPFPGGGSGAVGSPISGSSGSPSGAPGSPTGPTSPPGTPGGSDSSGSPSSSSFGGSNQTFGGGGIIGFEPASEKQSILVYKKKDHYNQWEFTYSPLSDQRMISGGNTGTAGQPVSGPGTNQPQNGPGSPSPTPAPTPQQ